jgi:hypothetical protein
MSHDRKMLPIFLISGVRLLVLLPLLAYCTSPRWWWLWRNWWNKVWQGKPKYSETTYPSVTLFITKSHMTRTGFEPGPPRWEASDNFFYLVCKAIGTAATPGLLCQPRLNWRWMWRSRWNVDWQGKPKFLEKTYPSATFVHHKIPHNQTRVWTWAAAVGSRRLTAWAMARPYKQ